jgi:hypothetical protein
VLGAENQQERLDPWWIVGFVDGEGSFLVSTFRNETCKSGKQTLFEFVVTQGEESREAMKSIKDFFNCGGIYINHRHDNHHHDLLRYCVRNQKDLKWVIIPFFKKYPLKTTKRNQFNEFCNRIGV